MRAIILAAGRGSRMKSLTIDQPKCLIAVNGKPLLEWQISALKAAGIDEIAIVTGYRRELLQSYGLKEFHNSGWAKTQMVTSLTCAAEWLLSGDCIVSYSDIFYEAQAIGSLIECKAELCITHDPHWEELWRQRFDDPLSDAETFRVDSEGYLLEIGGKAETMAEINGQYMGLLKFSIDGAKKFLKTCGDLDPHIMANMHMTQLLNLMIQKYGRLIK